MDKLKEITLRLPKGMSPEKAKEIIDKWSNETGILIYDNNGKVYNPKFIKLNQLKTIKL